MRMYLTPLGARESARDYALRSIKENIVRLTLAPGSMVSEQELATELNLSRTPVREALIELSKVKIVEIYPQRGSRITLVDYAMVEEAQFMREALECAVAKRCCERGIPPEQHALLLENLRLQAFHLERRSHRLLELDNEFHRQLFSIAGLTQVYALMDSMMIHFDRIRALSLTAVRELTSVQDHYAILDAILRGDAEAAQSLTHRHLRQYQIDQDAVRQAFPHYFTDQVKEQSL